ncbi:Uncharacterised protein [Mycobacterium tuberculosis]|nr:Uncharacterised protein [Mycobacterium tuberculosis]
MLTAANVLFMEFIANLSTTPLSSVMVSTTSSTTTMAAHRRCSTPIRSRTSSCQT